VRLKRVPFRSWHRGTQESDLIPGSFGETYLTGFDSIQLDQFKALLDCADTDLFAWIIGGSAPPPQHDHDVMRRLRDSCARPSRTPEQHGQSALHLTT
jgi:antitoxin CptB